MSIVIASFVAALAATLSFAVIAQPPASAAAARAAEPPGERPRVARPPLFLKEDWKQIPGGGEHPVTPASVTAANVELKLYGASSKEIQLTGVDGDENNPRTSGQVSARRHAGSRCATRRATSISRVSRGFAGT